MIYALLTRSNSEGEKRVEARLELRIYNCTVAEVQSDLLDDVLAGRDTKGWMLQKLEERK